MTRLLVIRFSALGDVAMTVPVVRQVATLYPDTDITVLSRAQTQPLWRNMPPNVHFFGVDIKGRHKGIKGLQQLMRDIDYKQFDAVADLHDVLRSLWIDRKLLMAGKRVAIIRKGRFRKWLMVRHLIGGKSYLQVPMQTTVQRYKAVFSRLGYQLPEIADFDNNNTNRHGIGIAPFAAHKGKIYPMHLMEEVVRSLSALLQPLGEPIYLFGAGEKEQTVLENWEKKYAGVVSLAGKHPMDEEIGIMSGLRLMLTMDSANMHLASLAGTRALTIWGATHPVLGFLGFGQQESDCIQRDLPCRPCSVYGKRACSHKDKIEGEYRCLNIAPQQVVEKVKEALDIH